MTLHSSNGKWHEPTTAERIETRIGQVDVRLGSEWAERLQRDFVRYFEECEVGNLEVTPHPGLH